MRRRVEFSALAHYREQYAVGRITLDQFEVLIEVALRAERLPKRPKADRSPEACAERWHMNVAAKALNYTQGYAAVSSRPTT